MTVIVFSPISYMHSFYVETYASVRSTPAVLYDHDILAQSECCMFAMIIIFQWQKAVYLWEK
jgi:hypothetical protein